MLNFIGRKYLEVGVVGKPITQSSNACEKVQNIVLFH